MTHQNLKVAVLMGGAGAEAAVSRASAAQVQAALTAAGHRGQLIELDAACAATLLELDPDVVFPALHGPPGEDGTVQGFLELLGYPYVGSGVHGSAMAMDKAAAKDVFRRHGLPVTEDYLVAPTAAETLDLEAEKITQRLGPRVVVKPMSQGSAIGVTPLPNGGDIAGALEDGLRYGPCLVEPFISGKEITVGVLEVASDLVPHPVIEIVTATDEWYDYENRYAPGQSEHIVPAALGASLSRRLQEIAVEAHRVLGLRDLSRADFIVTDLDDIALLEVNTLPGMTPTSLYPDGARHLGYEFPALIDHLVARAWQRR